MNYEAMQLKTFLYLVDLTVKHNNKVFTVDNTSNNQFMYCRKTGYIHSLGLGIRGFEYKLSDDVILYIKLTLDNLQRH